MPDKQGFTLLECLVALCVISVLSLLAVPFVHPVSFDFATVAVDSLVLQSKAMVQRQTLSANLQGIDFTYHLTGNPSSCNSYQINQRQLIVHLGWGRLSVK